MFQARPHSSSPSIIYNLTSSPKPAVLNTVRDLGPPMSSHPFTHSNDVLFFLLSRDSSKSPLIFSSCQRVNSLIILSTQGHTACGAARAAYNDVFGREGEYKADEDCPHDITPLALWLAPLVKLAREVLQKPTSSLDRHAGVLQLIEENVRRQVDTVSRSPILQKAWIDEGRDSMCIIWSPNLNRSSTVTDFALSTSHSARLDSHTRNGSHSRPRHLSQRKQ